MNGQGFLRIATEALVPFLRELGFVMDEPSISGRYYRASFTGIAHAVSISYEPGDDALFVMVLSRKNGELSDIDDRAETPRLADLNDEAARNDTRPSTERLAEISDPPRGETRNLRARFAHFSEACQRSGKIGGYRLGHDQLVAGWSLRTPRGPLHGGH